MKSLITMVEEELVYSGLIEMQELDAPWMAPQKYQAIGLIRTRLHTLLHKVVSRICTLITKYHFILFNLQRHNFQLGYWWMAWSRWMIWTSHSDRRELGPLPTSPQRTCPGWTTRTSIGKPEEWSTKIKGMRAENGRNSTLNMEKKMFVWKCAMS